MTFGTVKKLVAFIALATIGLAALWYAFGRHYREARKLPGSIAEFRHQPGGDFTLKAGDYLISLAKKGQLPGFLKGEHGRMIAPNFDFAQAKSGTNGELRVIVFTKNGDSSEYYYTVGRSATDCALQLEKAWRANSSGRIVEEYPVQ